MGDIGRSRLLTGSLAALAVAGCISAARAAPPPVEAFAALPAVSNLDISPDGNLIAWADQTDVEPRLAVFDLAAKRYRLRFSVGKTGKLRNVRWADDRIVLVEISALDLKKPLRDQRFEIWRTYAVNVENGTSHDLLMKGGERRFVTGATVYATHIGKPGKVVMSTFDFAAGAYREEAGTRLAGHARDSGWISGLYEVDTATGKGTVIEQGTSLTDGWAVDAEGQAVARSEWDPVTARYWIVALGKASRPEIYSRKGRGDMQLQGLTEDRKSILAIAPNDAGKRVLWAIALDGSGRNVFYEDPADDAEAVKFDPYTGRPLAVWIGGSQRQFHWFDKVTEARFASLSRAFKDAWVRADGSSADGQRTVVHVDSPSKPAVYYVVDFAKGTADIVGEEYPALAGAALGEVREISYAARDGTSIPTFLTLPPAIEAKKIPLVVLPHGGPEGEDDWGFDWWAQFLATRGYAVLQPQFRGSTGHGDAFRRAGYHQWGRLMQDDVTDGVKAMIALGIADASRVCIVGASYGGYAALAGAAFTPDLYKCAVSVAGVSDLPEMLYTVKSRDSDESDAFRYWLESIGQPSDPAVIERSPARAADGIKIPILLLHGLDDTVVPIAQSERMARELEKHGKSFTFVKLNGEDHWLSRADTRLQMLQEIGRFLAKNL